MTVEIRELTAAEYVEILSQHDVQLRVSDGTSEGTWRFWMDDGQLWYRRMSWTEDKPESPDFLQCVLDEDGTTQLVKEVSGASFAESTRPEGWPEMYSAAGRSANCPHQMHWDESSEEYQCIYDCGEVDEEPPERYLDTDSEGQGGDL